VVLVDLNTPSLTLGLEVVKEMSHPQCHAECCEPFSVLTALVFSPVAVVLLGLPF
jgi:hypothetical protein